MAAPPGSGWDGVPDKVEGSGSDTTYAYMQKVELLFKSQVADLVSFALPSDELEPGTTVPIRVAIRPFGQQLSFITIPVEVSRSLAGQTVKIEVQAGSQVKPELAPPDNLTDFIDNLRKGFSAKSLVVTMTTGDEGVNLRGCQRPCWRRCAPVPTAVAARYKSVSIERPRMSTG